VDAGKRLSETQRLRVRTLLARHIKVFALNPKDPVHTHLLGGRATYQGGGTVPRLYAGSRLSETGSTIVEAHVAQMEANGIIRKSNSSRSRVV
jgi:hypothetical protein